MRRDFHFYALYSLLCCIGMKPEIAYTVAYASEHVDNAKNDKAIQFVEGGQFKPIRSAHPLLSTRFINKQTALSLYMPFHFFPCCEGNSFLEKVVCRPFSTGLEALKDEVAKVCTLDYGAHYLGVALHIIADSHAHQNFSALPHKMNDVNTLKLCDNAIIRPFLSLSSPLPPYGHLKALILPDEPSFQWSYVDWKGVLHEVDNLYRYERCLHEIYQWVLDGIKPLVPDWFSEPAQNYDAICERIMPLLDLNMLPEDRVRAWERALEQKYFDAVPFKVYDASLWQNEAIETTEKAFRHQYSRKPNYATSNLTYFYAALTHHIHFCRYVLFPKHDIYI